MLNEVLRPGYHFRAAFEGAEASERPLMAYLGHMLQYYWSIRTVTRLHQHGPLIVECRSVWWTISDNGGEIHMHRINDVGNPPPDAPYSQGGMRVPIGRLAWFVAMTLLGEPIDGYGANDAVDGLIIEEPIV